MAPVRIRPLAGRRKQPKGLVVFVLVQHIHTFSVLPLPFHMSRLSLYSLGKMFTDFEADCRDHQQISSCFHCRQLKRCTVRPSSNLRVG
jgi:hypothetical protein